MWLRFLLFFVVLFGLLAGIHVYVYRRAASTFGLKKRGKRILGAVLVLGLLALILGRATRGGLPAHVAEALAVAGSTVALGALIAFGLLLPIDLGRLLWSLPRRLRNLKSKRSSPPPRLPVQKQGEEATAPEAAPEAPALPRRDFLLRTASGAALLAGGGTAAYGALIGRHDYAIEEVPIRLPGLPPALDGYTIAQLSDIHFGTFVDGPELLDAEDLVRRAKPDLVVLTGDLVDHDARYARYLGRLVERIGPHTRDGVVAIPGNHDYYAGIEAVVSTLARAGAEVLRNDGRVVRADDGGGFSLLGVDDVWSPRYGLGKGADLDAAIAQVPSDLPRVLLCHNPVFFPEAAGKVQLQLSGHTHGGQVNVVSRKPAELVLPFGYVAGRYTRGDSQLYVNRGFGVAGPPARVGSPPELTRIVLTT